MNGFEYMTVQINAASDDPAQTLTVETNRVAQYGWRLIAPPVRQVASFFYATFERPKVWPEA